MSPKVSRPAGEPDKTGLPPGHVPMRPPVRPAPEQRKPISLWWKLSAYVVLLVGTVVAIVYVGRAVEPRRSAQGAAELVAESITEHDISAFRSCLCNVKLESFDALTDLGPTTVMSVTEEDDGVATASLRSHGFGPLVVFTLLLHNKDGSWCVADVTY